MKLGQILINVEDMVGKRLGKLEVSSYAGCAYDYTKAGFKMRHRYICKCDCGKVTLVRRSSLKNGKVKSCGCLKRKKK